MKRKIGSQNYLGYHRYHKVLGLVLFLLPFLLMFLSGYIYSRDLDTIIDYVVIGFIFLFILLSLISPRINKTMLRVSKNRDINSRILTIKSDVMAIRIQLEKIAEEKHTNNSKIESIERSIQPLLKDFDSIREIVKVVQLKTMDDNDLLSSGKLKHLNEDFKGASLMFKALIEKEPDNPRGYSNISYCFEKLGKIDEAIKSIEKAIEISPNNDTNEQSKYRYHLSRYLVKISQDNSCEESLKRAVVEFKKITHPMYIEKAFCLPEYEPILEYIYSDKS